MKRSMCLIQFIIIISSIVFCNRDAHAVLFTNTSMIFDKPGWFLLGWASDTTFIVDSALYTPAEAESPIVNSIWKWDGNTWDVYLPGSGTASYAKSKNFNVLSTIIKGEGFWMDVSVPGEVIFNPIFQDPNLVRESPKIPWSWHANSGLGLLMVGNMTISVFNNYLEIYFKRTSLITSYTGFKYVFPPVSCFKFISQDKAYGVTINAENLSDSKMLGETIKQDDYSITFRFTHIPPSFNLSLPIKLPSSVYPLLSTSGPIDFLAYSLEF